MEEKQVMQDLIEYGKKRFKETYNRDPEKWELYEFIKQMVISVMGV